MRRILEDYNYKRNWLFILLSNPNVYLYRLLANTIIVGLITLLLNWLYIHSSWHGLKIPIAMHSTIIVAVSFVLAFRANTSYDRWFEGKKSITAMSNAANMFAIKLRVCSDKIDVKDKKEIKDLILKFLDIFQHYLKDEDGTHSDKLREEQNETIYNMMSKLKALEVAGLSQPDLMVLEKSFAELVSYATTCERIKDTPIPMNYAMHIKVSIFVFILSLPFGIFYDLQLWSSLMVMVVFYILYGIELISAEIENPFYGDPNDIPLDDFIAKTTKTIEKNFR